MSNDLTVSNQNQLAPKNSALEIETARATQEVQGAIISAKRFPRDQFAAEQRILTACKRRRLAESAMYEFPRGGQKVTGPSIRLAEVLAQNWGNLKFGIRELENKDGESTVEAFCWDLETNVYQSKVFTVPHCIQTRQGQKWLEDPRDIYELVANQGSRRLRACILAIIPGDIQQAAVEQCEKTLEGDQSEPIEDRIKKMLAAFKELSVTQEMIEKRLKHKIDVTSNTELVNLQKIWVSVRDGMSKREDWFEVPAATKGAAAELNAKLKEGEKK